MGTYHRFNATFAGYSADKQRTDSDFLGLGLTRDPGYTRFDLAASYNFIGGFSVYGRAINLFNESYQDALGYPALGRSVQVGPTNLPATDLCLPRYSFRGAGEGRTALWRCMPFEAIRGYKVVALRPL